MTVALMIGIRYLAKNYTYTVEPSDDGSGLLDLVVTEQYGRRLSVVCRVRVSSVEKITSITRENQKEIAATVKGKRVFTYTGEISPRGLCLLYVCIEDEEFYLKIDADERLSGILNAD